ncbi:MAG: type 2 lanthipeptide synthetase LanM [Candidatus Micrarchaeaceae archaeon]
MLLFLNHLSVKSGLVHDVPYFSTTFGSHDASASECEIIPRLFSQTPSDLLKGQISQLSDQDLAAQLRIMRSSLGMSGKRSEHDPYSMGIAIIHSKSDRRSLLIGEAERIADHVAELAIYREGRPYWTSHAYVDDSGPGTFVPSAETNLYNGELGIALFLGALGFVAQRSDSKELALKTLKWIRAGIYSPQSRLMGSGAYLGASGYVYTSALLGHLYDDNELIEAAKLALPSIKQGLAAEVSHSVINGASSAVLALDAIKYYLPEKAVCRLIRECCEKIVEVAIEQSNGVTWMEDADADLPLTGFAHGAAGYAAALVTGGHLVGETKWVALGLQAIEYERANFVKGKRNWADHRKIARESDRNIFAWCTGAPGIGLSRIRIWPFVNRNEREIYFTSEIGTAIKGTLSYGLGDNHSLCHGDMGNLDFLSQASSRISDHRLAETVNDRLDWVLQNMRTKGWRCASVSQKSDAGLGELPGLMLGLSGIGMGLLRLAEPDSVPSVLGPNGIAQMHT